MDEFLLVNEEKRTYQVKSVIVDKSFQFAIEVLKYAKRLKSEGNYEIASQFLRSGTAIGANVEEAQAGFSKKDFSFKISLALKEARETRYWIRLIVESEISDPPKGLIEKVEELIRILTAISRKVASYKDRER